MKVKILSTLLVIPFLSGCFGDEHGNGDTYYTSTPLYSEPDSVVLKSINTASLHKDVICGSYSNKLDIFKGLVETGLPQITVLQEVSQSIPRDGYQDQPKDLMNKVNQNNGVFSWINHNSSLYGTLTMSNLSVDSYQTVLLDVEGSDDTNQFFTISHIEGYTIANIHFTSKSSDSAVEQAKMLFEKINLPNYENFMIIGDFNIVANTASYEKLKEVMESKGLSNPYESTQSCLSTGMCTFPSTNPSRQIDYIFGGSNIVFNDVVVDTVKVGECYLTDHNMLSMNIHKLNKGETL